MVAADRKESIENEELDAGMDCFFYPLDDGKTIDQNAPRSIKAERDTDYTDEDRELWEESLKEAIFAAQAKLRLGSSSRIGGAALHQEAEALGIGRERLHRIMSAADAGFDWDNAVFDMEHNGMSRRAAEEVTERLAADIFAKRVLDGDLSDSRESQTDLVDCRNFRDCANGHIRLALLGVAECGCRFRASMVWQQRSFR